MHLVSARACTSGVPKTISSLKRAGEGAKGVHEGEKGSAALLIAGAAAEER